MTPRYEYRRRLIDRLRAKGLAEADYWESLFYRWCRIYGDDVVLAPEWWSSGRSLPRKRYQSPAASILFEASRPAQEAFEKIYEIIGHHRTKDAFVGRVCGGGNGWLYLIIQGQRKSIRTPYRIEQFYQAYICYALALKVFGFTASAIIGVGDDGLTKLETEQRKVASHLWQSGNWDKWEDK